MINKRQVGWPAGLVVVGVSLWASSAIASPAFLTSPSLSDLGSSLGSLPGLMMMALAEDGRSQDRGGHDRAEHERGEHRESADHRGGRGEHAEHGEHAERGRRSEQSERGRAEQQEHQQHRSPEARDGRPRPEPRVERSAERAAPPQRGPRPVSGPPRAPGMGRGPSAGGPPAPMMRGPMGPGPQMGPPWMRGPAGPSFGMGRMPMGPSAGRRPFGGPPSPGAHGAPGGDTSEQVLRQKLMEMEMRIRKLEAEVRRLREDD